MVLEPGQAVEIEFPMTDRDLEAFKYAYQITMTNQKFVKDGFQVFVEIFVDNTVNRQDIFQLN